MATWNSTGSEDITFADGFGGISSLNVGPDGYLYVISLFTAQSTKSCPLSSVNNGERFLSHDTVHYHTALIIHLTKYGHYSNNCSVHVDM